MKPPLNTARRSRGMRAAERGGENALPLSENRPGETAPRTILYVDHTASLSGGEIALLHLLHALDPTRYTPVVVLGQDGPLLTRLRAEGIETHLLPLAPQVAHTRKDTLHPTSLLRLGAAAHSLLHLPARALHPGKRRRSRPHQLPQSRSARRRCRPPGPRSRHLACPRSHRRRLPASGGGARLPVPVSSASQLHHRQLPGDPHHPGHSSFSAGDGHPQWGGQEAPACRPRWHSRWRLLRGGEWVERGGGGGVSGGGVVRAFGAGFGSGGDRSGGTFEPVEGAAHLPGGGSVGGAVVSGDAFCSDRFGSVRGGGVCGGVACAGGASGFGGGGGVYGFLFGCVVSDAEPGYRGACLDDGGAFWSGGGGGDVGGEGGGGDEWGGRTGDRGGGRDGFVGSDGGCAGVGGGVVCVAIGSGASSADGEGRKEASPRTFLHRTHRQKGRT